MTAKLRYLENCNNFATGPSTLSVLFLKEDSGHYAPYKRNERKTEPRSLPFMHHLSLKTSCIQVLMRTCYIGKQ